VTPCRSSRVHALLFVFRADKRNTSVESKSSDVDPLLNKAHRPVPTRDSDLSSIAHRMTSKVTFDSLMKRAAATTTATTTTTTPLPPPKTKDQGVMAKIDVQRDCHWSNEVDVVQQDRQPIVSEQMTSDVRGSMSNKSSVRELVQNQKLANRRKSKSQNRARKALRTITFILGKFVERANKRSTSRRSCSSQA
jgi:hypothetical protein